MADIIVVGGGIIGLATARRLQREASGSEVVVLEKEPGVAFHQTGRNSGVVHAGVYYPPGSLKARLCRAGAVQLRDYCRERGLRYDECGKLIVAVEDSELERLVGILRRGLANGVPGIRKLDAGQMRQIEPHVAGIAAIYSPQTAIVDFRAIAAQIAHDVIAGGGHVVTSARVTAIRNTKSGVVVETANERYPRLQAARVVVAAGLQADRTAAMVGDRGGPRILPFRGDYYRLLPAYRSLVRGLVYPVPDPQYPFLGIHVTRTISGDVLVGPNALLAISREGYVRRRWRDGVATAGWPGSWALARRHWRAAVNEMLHAASKRLFVREVRRYLPELEVGNVEPAPGGVRAQAVARDGSLVDDFLITSAGRVTNIRNAPSPAATSSLAIADYVVEHLPVDAY